MRSDVEAKIGDLKSAVAGTDLPDPAALQPKIEALQQALMQIGQAMYGQGQEAGPQGDGGGGAKREGGDDVVDAEFTEPEP